MPSQFFWLNDIAIVKNKLFELDYAQTSHEVHEQRTPAYIRTFLFTGG